MERAIRPIGASNLATSALRITVAILVTSQSIISPVTSTNQNLPHVMSAPPLTKALQRFSPVWRPNSSKTARLLAETSAMKYFGGRLSTEPLNVYIIWYGRQWTQQQKNIILGFIPMLSVTQQSPLNTIQKWWAINRSYTDKTGAKVTNQVNLKKTYSDYGSVGTRLVTDMGIYTVVRSAIAGGALPADKDGVYLVLTDPSISVQGFCTAFCGYHSTVMVTAPTGGEYRIPYAFVGNPTKCPRKISTCTAFNTGRASPNKDPGVDSMVSIIAHELAEVATDPEENGWYFAKDNGVYHRENADACAYTYGTLFSCGSRCAYNVVGLNNSRFLVQQNYDVRTGECTKTGSDV